MTFAEQEQRSKAESSGHGWGVYSNKAGGFELAYYLGRERRKHRIPRDRDTRDRRAKYAKGYVDAKRELFVRGEIEPRKAASVAVDEPPKVPTFAQFAKRWTDGELHEDYPDHVRAIDHGQ